MPPKAPGRDFPSYKQKYLSLKKKFKALVYEHETFQEKLRQEEHTLIRISRDKSYLLDCLMKYETVETSTSDSDATVTSDTDPEASAQIHAIKKCSTNAKKVPVRNVKNLAKKKRTNNVEAKFTSNASMNTAAAAPIKRKKPRKTAPHAKPGSAATKTSSDPSFITLADLPKTNRSNFAPEAATKPESFFYSVSPHPMMHSGFISEKTIYDPRSPVKNTLSKIPLMRKSSNAMKVKPDPAFPLDLNFPMLQRSSGVVPSATITDPTKCTSVNIDSLSIELEDGRMTSEEIERHLDAKQSLRDLMPEKAPLTLPIEIFSNDPSETECDMLDEIFPNGV